MRLLLTAVVPSDHRAADLAVEAEPATTVADLARTLALHLGLVPQPQPVARGVLGVVGDLTDPGWSPPAEVPPPVLWLDGVPLDPLERLGSGPVRHGAVIGVGGPLPRVLAEPSGLVEVRVASGPGAGTVHRLGVGSFVVGAAADCTVRLADGPAVALRGEVAPGGAVTVVPDSGVVGVRRPTALRRRPLPGPVVIPRDPAMMPKLRPQRWWRRYKDDPTAGLPHEAIDPADAAPVVHLDRRALDQPRPWLPGEALVVAGTLLDLARAEAPDASLSPSPQGATSDYNRPPRILPDPRPTKFSLPQEPSRPEKQPIPMIMVFAPIAMALAAYWFTKSPYSLIFAVFSPMMAISNVTTSRRQGTKRYREQMAEYRARSRKIREEAYAALQAERTARRRDLPDPGALLLVATGPRARLWERRRSDPDWLQLRIGTADAPSEITLRDPKREEHEGPLTWTTPDVPVAVDLAKVGVAGVAGSAGRRRSVGRWTVAQAAVLHSPADLGIIVLAGPDGDDDWSWVRWLPHTRPDASADALARVGADDATIATRVAELVALMQARHALRRDNRAPDDGGPPVLVVLDGARRLRLLPGVVSLLQDGPAVNLHFLCLDDDARALPEECRAVVHAGYGIDEPAELQVSEQAPVEGVRLDEVGVAWCERVGRALAPVLDVSSEDLAGALPTSSRLLDVLHLDPPRPATLVAGWAHGGRSTRAVIGEGADGPFSVDIRADGPHGLIAGTTGSGKSELLQTLIASLAVANRPDELTFVLVDYKGGAAFKDCAHLPHTVGMVTDLDGHLTTRALESLGAELRRREHQLAAAGAKDIEDYLRTRDLGDSTDALVVGVHGGQSRPRRSTPSLPPMPRLMLVIDEFAALVAELPDFVTGLVDIARRGRSLGVHLLLATQRPAGVVSAEIKSNTTLRIALRVTDPQDSQDVVETTDAATIPRSLPGRAYARLGHASMTAFQSARVGGRPPGSGPASIGLRPVGWDSIGSPSLVADVVDDEDVSTPTDLATLVGAIREATSLAGVEVPPSPWLPALPDVVTLEDVDPLAEGRDGVVPPIVVGVVDLPAQQRREPAVLDLADASHLAVIGAPRAGRSSVLRAVAGSVGRSCSPADVHLYGVDCGNNALLPMLALPHTGAVITRDQPDRLARFTARVLGEISQRQQLLAERGYADLAEQRAAAEESRRLPYLVVLLDRWEGFVSAFESFDSGRLVDQWQQILQEGAGVGVVVVLTSDRTALSGRLSTLADDKLVLRMTDPADLSTIGLPIKQVPDHMPPGRGFRAEGVAETQIALLDKDPSGTVQVAALQAIGRRAQDRFARLAAERRPFRVDQLPARMSLADAALLGGRHGRESELPVGVGGDTLALQYLDLVDHGPGFVVAGPRRSGRSTVLCLLGGAALAGGLRVGVVTARTSPLRDFAGRDGVVAALTPETDRADGLDLLKSLRPQPGQPPSLLLVDDLEVIGTDGWLADALAEHVGVLRDSGCAVVGAGTTDDLGGVYRGPVVALKKSRSGVLLAPAAPNDGDVFGLRLPRSVLGANVPGRGILVQAGQWMSVQVVSPL